jgi:uncharacterized protein (DUF302 family)
MFKSAAIIGFTFAFMTAATAPHALAGSDGVIKVKSAYPVAESVTRIKADVEAKGIMFFGVIDQSALAEGAGIDLKPSSLVVFGNPPLGTQFITAKPEAGLDWPVRVLVYEDAKGQVWAAYTDFEWIAKRHGIKNRKAQFKMASEVITSITGSLKSK